MKRVLLTGASGFIGAHALHQLQDRGFEVHAAGRTRPAGDCVFHQADLLEPADLRGLLAASAPTHLLHLAWYAEPGLYWRSPVNLDWVAASLRLGRLFAESGGRRMVAAGTCAEYSWGEPCLTENETPCRPATLYGVAKDALHRLLLAFAAEVGLSFAWGRVFFLYGPGEKRGRLVSDAVCSLLSGTTFPTSHGNQQRDFMHVSDVAGAFASLLDSDVQGAVNIGSGSAVAVRRVLEVVAHETGGHELIQYGARTLPASEPATIVAATRRLREEVGFRPRYDLAGGLADTVRWWRASAQRPPAGNDRAAPPRAG